MSHHLMGFAEIAELLGVSRQRVTQLRASDPTFPKPISVLRATPVWESADGEKWARETGRIE